MSIRSMDKGTAPFSVKSNANLDDIVNQSRQKYGIMKKPQKQGRMFQLDLGQNEGPFKQKEINGCPQIDKFATYGLNSIVNKKMSPRIGILGASTFPSENDFQYTSGMGSNPAGAISNSKL